MPILSSILPKADFGHGIPDIDAARLITCALFLVFLASVAVEKNLRLYSKWIAILAILSIITIASVSWSNYSYSPHIIKELFEIVFMPLIIAIIAMNIFARERSGEFYIKHIIIASFFLSLISGFQMLAAILTGQELTRATSTFNNPNALAIFLVLTIPCIMYGIEKQIIARKFGMIVYAVLIGGIICTVSRKGIFTMVLSFCLYNFFKKQYKKIVFLIVVSAFLAVVLYGLPFIHQRFEGTDVAYHLQGKWNMTVAGFDMFLKSPIIGLGYKGYFDRFGDYFYGMMDITKYDAHNIFITALANYGLLGFIPFMAVFLYPLRVSVRTLKHSDMIIQNDYSRDMAVVCICSIIPFMINGWFAGNLFYTPHTMFLLYTNIALLLSKTD